MAEETFDPSAHNIADVEKHLAENPDQLQAVLDAEKARGDAARSTLVESLEKQVSETPKPSEGPALDVTPGVASNEEVQTTRIAGDEYTVDPLKGYRVKAGREA